MKGYGMEVINTHWAVESCLKLVRAGVFSKKEHDEILHPDILLLKNFPRHEKFANSKFWGLASIRGKIIKHGFKMKWHNMGNGKIQLRLAVAIINHKAILCQWYVKGDDKTEQRELNKFKIKIQKIIENEYEVRGML